MTEGFPQSPHDQECEMSVPTSRKKLRPPTYVSSKRWDSAIDLCDPNSAEVNYCFCNDCVPPLKHSGAGSFDTLDDLASRPILIRQRRFKNSTESCAQHSDDTEDSGLECANEEIGMVASCLGSRRRSPSTFNDALINPLMRPDPADSSWLARFLYWFAIAFTALLRSFTMICAVCLAIDATLSDFIGARLPSSVWWIMTTEVGLSLTIGLPYMIICQQWWSRQRMPYLAREERWRMFTEMIHACHPHAITPSAAIERFACSTDYEGAKSAFLMSSRPLPGPSGHTYHITQHCGTWLSGWFFGAKPCVIREGNLKEWFAWALFNRNVSDLSKDDTDQLNAMVQYMAQETGLRLRAGYNSKIRCIRLNLDDVHIKWRSSLLTLAATLSQWCGLFVLWLCGYTTVHSADGSAMIHLPRSIVKRVSANSAENHEMVASPIFFMHGLGVGLIGYLCSMAWMRWGTGRPVIFLNVPTIVVQWTRARPPTPQCLNEFVRKVWYQYNIPLATGLAHSMGTGFLSWMVKDHRTTPDLSRKAPHLPLGEASVLHSAVFLDPICFGLIWSDIAANFLYRTPHTYARVFMRYMGGRDVNVANFLYRGFWWHQMALFKFQWAHLVGSSTLPRPRRSNNFKERSFDGVGVGAASSAKEFSEDFSLDRMAVLLSEYDSIVNSETVRRYFVREGFMSWRLMQKIGHGGMLFYFSWWSKVLVTVQRISANAEAQIKQIK